MTLTIKITISQSHMSYAGVTDSRLWLAISADNGFFRFFVQSPHFSRPVSRFSQQYKLMIFAALPPSFRKHRDDNRLAVTFTIASRAGSRQAAVPACTTWIAKATLTEGRRTRMSPIIVLTCNDHRKCTTTVLQHSHVTRGLVTGTKGHCPHICPHFQFTFCSSNTPPRDEHRRLTNSLLLTHQGMSGAISNYW